MAALALAGMMGLNAISSALNIREARKNRKFQERMSSTAHTREMADLKRAGLNPLLTGKYGGSSTPGGAQAAPIDLEKGVTSAAEISMKGQQKKLMQSQIGVANSQSQLNQSNSAKSVVEAEKIQAETPAITQEASRRENIFPLEMDKLIQDIESSKTGQSKQAQELKHLIEEFKKLQVQRKLWDLAGRLTPEAKTVETKLKQLGKSFKGADKKHIKAKNKVQNALDKHRKKHGLKPRKYFNN